MERIIEVKALPGWVLEVVFNDRRRGRIHLKDRLFGPAFEPLRDEKLFAQVEIDEFGALCWPTGADLSPDGLYRRLRESGKLREPLEK